MAEENKEYMPRLRFPEFAATPWKISALEECCEFFDSRRKPITMEDRRSGPYPYYGASGIIDYVDDYIFDEKLLLIGEDGAKWGRFEKTAFIATGKYWVNNHAHVLKTPIYIDTLLENYFYYFDFSGLITGAAPPKLTLAKLKKLRIPLPRSKAEQQKIADCLSSLDELIKAHEQKRDALVEHKKGLMQRLFPAEGETTPRWRFPEFRKEKKWDTNPLGTLATKIGSGVTPRGGEQNYLSSGVPFVRSQNVGWGKLLLNDIVYIPYEIHETFLSTELHIEDVLLNITGASIGRCALVDNEISGGNVNQHVCIIRVKKEKLNSIFLMQYIISAMGQKQIDSYQAGGNRQGLNFAQVAAFDIPLPSLPEQQKIADCLSSLDARIEAEEAKIASLREHKQGLMQRLFPQSL